MLIAHDLVVGPTHDGGYYLVGAKAAMLGFSTATGWGPTAHSTRCWPGLAGCGLPLASPIPSTTLMWSGDLTQPCRGAASCSGAGAANGGMVEGAASRSRRREAGRGRAVKLTPSHRLYGLGAILLVALTICARRFERQGEAFPVVPLVIAGFAYLLGGSRVLLHPKFPEAGGCHRLWCWRRCGTLRFLRYRRAPMTTFAAMFGMAGCSGSATTLTLWYLTIRRLPRCTRRRRAL